MNPFAQSLDLLASLTPGPRPVRHLLDDDGCRRAVELPTPAFVAAALQPWITSGRIFYRSGSAGLHWIQRGSDEIKPVNLERLARRIVAVLAEMPDRDDAGQPYYDLRFVCAEREGSAVDYARSVIREFRRSLPVRPREVRPAREARSSVSAAERVRRSKATAREQELETAAYVLHALLHPEDGDPAFLSGVPVLASELRGRVRGEALTLAADYRNFDPDREGYETFADLAEDEGWPTRPRVPGDRVTDEAALSLGLVKSRRAAGRVYLLP